MSHLVRKVPRAGVGLRAAVLVLTSVLLSAIAMPSPALAGPWEELFGPGKGRLWVDPSARFYLELPVGWTAEPRKGASSFVDLWKVNPDNGFRAHVTVEMRSLPPGVKAAHLAARVEEEARRAAYQFRMVQKDKIEISGTTGYRAYFTHQERNNAELTDEVVQVVFVATERAFIITFECGFGTRPVFWEEYERMMKTFVGRGVGEESLPLPKKQKPARSGEIVNPDAVPF